MRIISPVPTTRVSSLSFGQRLITQMRGDQVDLLRLQTQISTGRRIVLPSEDAPAALRGMSLQSLIERKTQVQTNLATNQSFLSATDTALASASGLINEARGSALSVAGSTSTDVQRQSAATDINRALERMVALANQNFRGRYLFAGSKTDREPFEIVGKYVRYNGNDSQLRSFSDLETLFDTNVSGHEAFGAFSSAVEGTADWNPVLSSSTRLADLRGGQGITLGRISMSDGTNTSSIDLGAAETVDDVIELIENNPPSGRTVSVTLSANGFNIQLDSAGGGNLTIGEVGGGATAEHLGILSSALVGTGPIVGGDVDPRVTTTTPLANVLGVRANAQVVSAGANNDLVIQANRRGSAFNGLAITFIDNGTVTAGNEVVTYNALANTVQINIDSGASTADQIMAKLNGNVAFSADFTTSLSTLDPDNNGDGTITIASSGTTSGGSGVEPDLTSGLKITNGGQTYNINLSSAATVEDVLNLLNGSAANVLAQINADGTGIDVRSRLSGSDFSIAENGGTTATDLGIRSFNRETQLDGLNHGIGVHSTDGADFAIRRKDGVQIQIDLGTARTIGDVLDLINNHIDNQDPAHRVVASLAANGNGIELSTSDASTANGLAVVKINNNQAAEDLGLIPVGQSTSDAAVVSGPTETITGRDVNPLEVSGVFNSLIRLRKALQTNNTLELERGLSQLEDDGVTVTFTRADVGTQQKAIEGMQDRLDSEIIDLKSNLSREIDTDLTEAISNLVARQAAYEASLQVAGQLARVSLLDFL